MKHMNSEKHKEYTGVFNDLILENAILAKAIVPEMIIRYPMIPGFNNDILNIKDMCRFIKNELAPIKRIDILPYHTMGASKRQILGEEYGYAITQSIDDEEIDQAKRIMEEYGFQVNVE